ncbi:MAG TPA: hypothetical protein VH395_09980 [Jatrophihabitantaceae bacterium]
MEITIPFAPKAAPAAVDPGIIVGPSPRGQFGTGTVLRRTMLVWGSRTSNVNLQSRSPSPITPQSVT